MVKTGNEFVKPYAKELFGKENVGFYPYPREELVKQPIFPYFILDGGAFNLMNDRFGTACGDDILDLTLSGKLFDIFRTDGVFNWETSFAYTEGTDFYKNYEWQIWPQRLYFTIPIAHKFLQTGEKKYAEYWLKIVKEWDKAHPYQEFDPEISYFFTDMTWRDMQVAWRTMSLLHGIFMLQDAPFTKDEWKYLYDFVKLHMNHLYVEALDRLARNHAQNHVLQIGVVLLLACAMFPEFENVEEMIKIGVDTVEMNLRNAIYDDGGSDEDSPSYSHFIARLYLEALFLIEQNGFPSISGLRESVKKQYEWLYTCMTPSGKALQLSDSYAFDAKKDFEYVSRLIDIDFSSEQKSVYYPQSHIAIFRKGDMTLFSDAAEWPGNHHHAGAPQIILYYKDTPIIVDTGVCNYDRLEFYGHVHEFKAHNNVYADIYEYLDLYDKKVEVKPTIEYVNLDDGEIRIKTNVCDNEGVSYIWTRSIKVDSKKLTIVDEATSEMSLPWKSHLLFAKNDVLFPKNDKNKMQLMTSHFIMTLRSDMKLKSVLSPVMDENNKLSYAVVAESENVGESFKNTTVIEFEDRSILK